MSMRKPRACGKCGAMKPYDEFSKNQIKVYGAEAKWASATTITPSGRKRMPRDHEPSCEKLR